MFNSGQILFDFTSPIRERHEQIGSPPFQLRIKLHDRLDCLALSDDQSKREKISTTNQFDVGPVNPLGQKLLIIKPQQHYSLT